ncbi:hypothetical protein OOZ51_18715 [Arthrobacter sp. MI7-26]|nr:hypothetical protein [Arthrobacter sp. MI7-26]
MSGGRGSGATKDRPLPVDGAVAFAEAPTHPPSIQHHLEPGVLRAQRPDVLVRQEVWDRPGSISTA